MMRRFEAWLLNISVLVVAATGVALHVMKEWLVPSDPFSVLGHPWQPATLKLHLAAAPVLIFAVGLVFSSHVLTKLGAEHAGGRRSGIAMLWFFVPMVVSGVLIQMLVSETLVQAVVWTHLGTGLIFAAGFLLHALLAPARSARTRRASATRAGDPFGRRRGARSARASRRPAAAMPGVSAARAGADMAGRNPRSPASPPRGSAPPHDETR